MLKRDLMDYLEELAPLKLAQNWDNCGLLVDCGHEHYKKVCVALDATPDMAAQAAELGADLLLTHHPIMLDGLKRVGADTLEGRLILDLIRNDISLCCMHTNLDSSRRGVNDALAGKIGLVNTVSLNPVRKDVKKLVVFAPEQAAQRVFDSMMKSAGSIGNYTHCSFQTAGTGTFLPNKDANPYIGEHGKLEKVREVRIETLVPAKLLEKTIAAMLEAHPYEEAAYDVFDVELYDEGVGLGFCGKLPSPAVFRQLAKDVKAALGCENVRVCGDMEKEIERVAVSSGGGFSCFEDAVKSGAQVFITGDIKHHNYLEAMHKGVCLIDAGHFETENIVVQRLIDCLQERFNNVKYDVVFVNLRGMSPFSTI